MGRKGGGFTYSTIPQGRLTFSVTLDEDIRHKYLLATYDTSTYPILPDININLMHIIKPRVVNRLIFCRPWCEVLCIRIPLRTD